MWVLLTTRGQQLAIPTLPAVLGNGPGADVRVPHESVLPQHARLSEGSAGTLRIEALGEGLLGVGGQRVERALLRDGDELVLGRVRFTLQAPATAAPPAGRPLAPPPPATALATRAPSATAAAADLQPELKQRRRTLQFSKVEAKRGLLAADLSQLPAGQRLLLTLGVLLLAGALAVGIALLFGLLG